MRTGEVPWGAPFSEVGAPWWDDMPAIIVGTGPSLTGFDFDRLRGLGHVLAVNAALGDLPWADAFFTLDIPLQRRDHKKLTELASTMPVYLGVPATYYPANYPPVVAGARYLKRIRANNKLHEKLNGVESGGHSGFGAFNLTVHKRARHIFMFGFDYRNGQHYCPNRYAHTPINHNSCYYPVWARSFDCTVAQIDKLGIRVINASPESRMTAFKRVTINDAIEQLKNLQNVRVQAA